MRFHRENKKKYSQCSVINIKPICVSIKIGIFNKTIGMFNSTAQYYFSGIGITGLHTQCVVFRFFFGVFFNRAESFSFLTSLTKLYYYYDDARVSKNKYGHLTNQSETYLGGQGGLKQSSRRKLYIFF